jgi:hypothetical protein
VPIPSREEQPPTRVFVAYPWKVHEDRDAYKDTFTAIAPYLNASFVFAEDEITPGHILGKITRMIEETAFGIYDLTGWNANVTLEYGIALGLKVDAFIIYNPAKEPDVPTDVRGYERSDYTTLAELSDKIINIVAPRTGASPPRVRAERDTGIGGSRVRQWAKGQAAANTEVRLPRPSWLADQS